MTDTDKPENGSLIVSDLPAVHGWRAWHVHIYDFTEQDEFLREIVAPLIEQANAGQDARLPWFFIRYWENGSHLRLRLRHLERRRFDEIGDRLFAAARTFARTPSTDALQKARPSSDGLPGDRNGQAMLPAGTVAEVAYDPEVRRYGGDHCIRGCEAAFERSSTMALRFLASGQSSARQRRGLGFLMSAIGAALSTSDHRELAGILAATRKTWARYLGHSDPRPASSRERPQRSREIADRVLSLALSARAGKHPNDPFAGEWMSLLEAEKVRLADLHTRGRLVSPATGMLTRTDDEARQAIASVFSSCTHMMMNRLGIVPALEYEFAGLLEEALDRLGQAQA